jgi:hypothetical protein
MRKVWTLGFVHVAKIQHACQCVKHLTIIPYKNQFSWAEGCCYCTYCWWPCPLCYNQSSKRGKGIFVCTLLETYICSVMISAWHIYILHAGLWKVRRSNLCFRQQHTHWSSVLPGEPNQQSLSRTLISILKAIIFVPFPQPCSANFQPLLRIFEPILKNASKELLHGSHTRAVSISTPSNSGIMKFAKKQLTCLGCKAVIRWLLWY